MQIPLALKGHLVAWRRSRGKLHVFQAASSLTPERAIACLNNMVLKVRLWTDRAACTMGSRDEGALRKGCGVVALTHQSCSGQMASRLQLIIGSMLLLQEGEVALGLLVNSPADRRSQMGVHRVQPGA